MKGKLWVTTRKARRRAVGRTPILATYRCGSVAVFQFLLIPDTFQDVMGYNVVTDEGYGVPVLDYDNPRWVVRPFLPKDAP